MTKMTSIRSVSSSLGAGGGEFFWRWGIVVAEPIRERWDVENID